MRGLPPPPLGHVRSLLGATAALLALSRSKRFDFNIWSAVSTFNRAGTAPPRARQMEASLFPPLRLASAALEIPSLPVSLTGEPNTTYPSRYWEARMTQKCSTVEL